MLLLLSGSQDDERDQRVSKHILPAAAARGAAETGARAHEPQGRRDAAAATLTAHMGHPPSYGASSAAEDDAFASEEQWSLDKLRMYLEYVDPNPTPTRPKTRARILPGDLGPNELHIYLMRVEAILLRSPTE